MLTKLSSSHYTVSWEDLRALSKAADPDTAKDEAFIWRLRSFLTPTTGQHPVPNTRILVPNKPSARIAVIDRILDTEASDIYSRKINGPSHAEQVYCWDYNPTACASAIPLLRHVLKTYSHISHIRYHCHAPLRRKELRRANRLLDKQLRDAKSLVNDIFEEALTWHGLHFAKERWRKALCQRIPEIKQHILHFTPPDEEYLDVQVEILRGSPRNFLSNAHCSHKLHFEKDSWADALCSLIPQLKDYFDYFRWNEPSDERAKQVQVDIMLKILQYRSSNQALV